MWLLTSSLSVCSSLGSLCRKEDKSVASDKLSSNACSALLENVKVAVNCNGSTWNEPDH